MRPFFLPSLVVQIGSAALGLCYLSGGTALVLAIGMMIVTASMDSPVVPSDISFGPE